MENQNDLIRQCELKALQWLDSPVYDDVTKKAVREMLDKEDKTDLIDSFYQNLAFGTGGLRGIMGPGSNRMNIYTVGYIFLTICVPRLKFLLLYVIYIVRVE